MKPFLATWATYLLVMELIAVLLFPRLHVLQKTDFRGSYAAGVLARTDPSHLYDLGQQMRVQVDLVGPENGWLMFIQPPYEALLFVPFSLLPYRAAYLLYLAFNIVLIVPCFLLARDAFSHVIDPWQPKPGLLFFFFVPLFVALVQGQASIRLLLFCCAAWHELKRGRDFNTGLLLALALFKMQVAIPLTVLLIIWRGFRLLAGFAAGIVIVLAVSLWLVGLRGVEALGRLLVGSTLITGESASAQLATAQYPEVMPNLRGLLYGCGGRHLPHSWLLTVTLALSAVLLLWIAYLLRGEQDKATGFALATIGALLLSYHLYIHDLTLLLLPIALLAGQARRYFTAIVFACFIWQPLLLVSGGEQFLWAVPMLGLVVLIARGSVGAELRSICSVSAD